MRISDWSSDVCSSDLVSRAEETIRRRSEGNRARPILGTAFAELKELDFSSVQSKITETNSFEGVSEAIEFAESAVRHAFAERAKEEQAQFKRIGEYIAIRDEERSEEHTYELQSIMRISNAVFCMRKKK